MSVELALWILTALEPSGHPGIPGLCSLHANGFDFSAVRLHPSLPVEGLA